MTARRVALLLLILAFGGAIDAAWFVRDHADLGPMGCRVLAGKFYGPSFSFDSEQTQAVAAGTAVEVQNAFGGVRITLLRGGRVQATVDAARGRLLLPEPERDGASPCPRTRRSPCATSTAPWTWRTSPQPTYGARSTR
jgi:hypothetical protein